MNEEDAITNVVDPIIIEIFLYKSNYKDRLLISELKEKAHTIKIPGIDDSSFFVKIDDMWEILNTTFKKDLKDFDSTPYDSLNSTVTSIFFIDSMIQSFDQLRYFRINVSDSPVYTRKKDDVISFDYKIIHSKIDLTEICSIEYLSFCKDLFKKLGFLNENPFNPVPYIEIPAKDLLGKIRNYLMSIDQESEEAEYILSLQLIFGTKLEKDNSTVLIILDV
jgi:hypothetical protein